MGQESSRLAEDDIRELESISSFTGEQIKALYKRFKAMDKDNLGFISESSFLSIPELSMNPLCDRIIRVFNSDGHKLVSFKQFVMVLSVFSEKSSLEDKLSFAFKVYDVNGDGFINLSDLYVILRLMVGSNMSDEKVNELARQIIIDVDVLDKDNSISFAEFKKAMSNTKIENTLTFNIGQP